MQSFGYTKFKKMSPQFLVSDLNKSAEFYTKLLGFEVAFRYEDFYLEITRDGHSIHLKWTDSFETKKETKIANEKLDLLFSVDQIVDLYEDLRYKPIEITQALRDMPYGREFYISDPDGYLIAFVEEKNI
jgi:catechol 2,3-dioxygenase-like lactoylglutathione lyase family enzyme